MASLGLLQGVVGYMYVRVYTYIQCTFKEVVSAHCSSQDCFEGVVILAGKDGLH